MPGRPSPKVKARLGEVEPGRRLTWHGNVGADWLFAGTREFLIDAEPDGTVRFTHVALPLVARKSSEWNRGVSWRAAPA